MKILYLEKKKQKQKKKKQMYLFSQSFPLNINPS